MSRPIIQKENMKAAAVTAKGRQRAFSLGATNKNAAETATTKITTSIAFRHNLMAMLKEISIVVDIHIQENIGGVHPYAGRLIKA